MVTMSKTPASIGHHPVHSMLIALPLGLWIFSFVCDLIFFFGGRMSVWWTVSLYSMCGGIVGAIIAAVPGFIDWLSLTAGTKAKTIGTWHMILNSTALLLYVLNVIWRRSAVEPTFGPFLLSCVLIVFLSVSGWLGGAMVYEHKVGVKDSE
jgi:uncharacterized membrane protein